MIALLAIAAWAQSTEPVPPELVGTGIDTAAWVLDRFGWPGLVLVAVLYMWRTRDKTAARWRGLPLVVQVEISPESAYIVGQAARGKRVESSLARRRREALRVLEEGEPSGEGGDAAHTPGGGT